MFRLLLRHRSQLWFALLLTVLALSSMALSAQESSPDPAGGLFQINGWVTPGNLILLVMLGVNYGALRTELKSDIKHNRRDIESLLSWTQLTAPESYARKDVIASELRAISQQMETLADHMESLNRKIS